MAGNFDRPAGKGGGKGTVFRNCPERQRYLSPVIQRDAQLLAAARDKLWKQILAIRIGISNGQPINPNHKSTFGVWRWLKNYTRSFQRNPIPCTPRVLNACCRILGLDAPPDPPKEEASSFLGPLPKKPPQKKPSNDDD